MGREGDVEQKLARRAGIRLRRMRAPKWLRLAAVTQSFFDVDRQHYLSLVASLLVA